MAGTEQNNETTRGARRARKGREGREEHAVRDARGTCETESPAADFRANAPAGPFVGVAPGVGCLFAVALCMTRTSDALPGLAEHGELFAAVCGLLAGMVLAISTRFLVRFAGRRNSHARPSSSARTQPERSRPQPERSEQPLPAGFLCLAGIAGIAVLECGALPHDPGGALSQAVAGVDGALAGAGIALLSCAWADIAAGEKPTRLVRQASEGLAITATCYTVFRCTAGVVPACCLLALYVAVSAGLCQRAILHGKAGGVADCSAGGYLDGGAGSTGGAVFSAANRDALLTAMADGGARVARMPVGSARLRDLYRMLWIALTGVLLSAFIVGLTWDPEAAYETSWRSSATGTWGPLAGAILASAGVLIATRGRGDEGCLRLLSSVFLPIALALVLVAPVVRQATVDPLVQLCCSIASTMGFSLFALAGFAELVLAARLNGASPGAAVGGLLVAIAGCVWAGFAAIGVWGTNGRVICLLFEAAVLTAVAISYALRPRSGADRTGASRGNDQSERGSRGERDAGMGVPASMGTGTISDLNGTGYPNGPDGPAARDTRCARLVARGALSQRETEVLAYLARGHGSAFIASELGISENTVRTHTRHIYEKLGVSSREELLALVYGPAE